MDRVRWGVLGCSRFAFRRTIPAMLASPSVELVAVASRDMGRAESFRRHFGLEQACGSYEELIARADIDAVHITVPNSLHCLWSRACLESGKHVLCEKPFAWEEEAAALLAQTCAATGRYFMEAFMWRFHPQHEMALSAVQAGEIGRVRLVRASFRYELEEPNIRTDRALGGGSLLDVGCYAVSAARHYLQAEPLDFSVSARHHPVYGIDTAVAALARFGDGAALLLDCAFDLPFFTELEVVGTQGRIHFPRPWQPQDKAEVLIGERTVVAEPANHYVRQFEHFSRSIIEAVPPRFGVEDAVAQARALAGMVAAACRPSAQP